METQWRFLTLKKRFKAYIGGIGSGKTYAGATLALITSVKHPGTTGLVVAPTYPMIRDVVLPTVFRVFPLLVVKKFVETKHELILKNGAKIIFRSADKPDKLRGLNLAWAWIDEAAYVTKQLWDIVLGRLRDKNGPRTAWLTTTPKGRNWIWELWVKEPSEEYGYIHATTYDNIYLPEDYIKSLEVRYSGEFFEQEVLGKFVKFEGLVYKEFDETNHVIDTLPERFKEVIAGVDWGFTNPAVILVVGFDYDGKAYVVEEFYERGRLINEVVEEAKKLKERWNIRIFYCDPSEPAFIQEFRRAGLYATAAKNDVNPGIATVQNLFAKNKLYIRKTCVNTVDELLSYRWREVREGGYMDVPIKEHDHAMDALRYAVFSHLTHSIKVAGGRYVVPERW